MDPPDQDQQHRIIGIAIPGAREEMLLSRSCASLVAWPCRLTAPFSTLPTRTTIASGTVASSQNLLLRNLESAEEKKTCHRSILLSRFRRVEKEPNCKKYCFLECCGSAFIWLFWIWIRIRIGNADSDPDPVVGVLDEPYSAKPAQRSSHTGPPGYIG
jgi:hypothetical protein